MAAEVESQYNKNNPFLAKLTENRLLNKEGSIKDTRHFVVDISGSDLSYESGDSLGVYPTNHPESVSELLKVLGADGSEQVTLPKEDQAISLREALSSRLSLASPTKKFLAALLDKLNDPAERETLEKLLEPANKDELADYLAKREFIDILEEYPSVSFSPEEFVSQLRKLVPRLYSIASSPAKHPKEIHLTVAVVRYTTNERQRYGVCSTFLAERVALDEASVPVFVTHSHFGLPEDESTDVIMVGPGTGIAPFRAFLQEREVKGSKGRNWLFFGDQHAASDFLYQEEFEAYEAEGLLNRFDTAWSRDQENKIYVQDRMLEKGAELWSWLQGGAHFYVCGDAKRMAKDVDAALHQIAMDHGGLGEAEAKDYFKLLKKEKRYQRDVY